MPAAHIRRALGPAFAFALALALRWPNGNTLVGDEVWTYLSALDPLHFYFADVHPPLWQALVLLPTHLFSREGVLVTAAVVSSLAAPLAAWGFGMGAGILLALWPSLVEAGGFARHPGMAATLAVAWAVLLRGESRFLPLAAHLMALGHASTQTVLLASLVVGKAREAAKGLFLNPLLYYEILRLLSLALTVGSGKGAPLVANVPAVLDAIFLPGAAAVGGAALLALGALRGPLLPFYLGGSVLLMLAVGGRFSEVYLAPAVALFLLPAGAALGRAWPVAFLLLPLSLQAAEGLEAARKEMAALVAAAKEEGLLRVSGSALPFLANGYRGPVEIVCPQEE